MGSVLILVKRFVHKCELTCLVIFCLWSTQAIARGHAAGGSRSSAGPATLAGHDPMVDAAFEHFYNLDYDRAIQEFERVLDRHPNDPAAINHLLTTVLLRELYKMGAMNTGEYANDSFIGEAHRTADPQVKARIK